MNFDTLCDFIKTKMRMAHIYQRRLIKSLIECDGMATLRQLAHGLLSQRHVVLKVKRYLPHLWAEEIKDIRRPYATVRGENEELPYG
jgi:hypothetical protein